MRSYGKRVKRVQNLEAVSALAPSPIGVSRSDDFDIPSDDEVIAVQHRPTRKTRHKAAKLHHSSSPVKLAQDTELDKKFFVESQNKPTWSPSKSPPARKSCERTLEKDVLELIPARERSSTPASVPRADIDAWNLIEDHHAPNPKLYSPRKSPKRSEARQDDRDLEAINDIYQRIVTTPKKKREAPSPGSLHSLQSSPSLLVSPRRQKTYASMRSYRAGNPEGDNGEEDEEDRQDHNGAERQQMALTPSQKSSPGNKIQDLNQLRANGRSFKFAEELDFWIEEFQEIQHKLMRSTALEFCAKLLAEREFSEYLTNTGLPDEIWKAMLHNIDPIITYCIIVVCRRIGSSSDGFSSQLANYASLMNKHLVAFKSGSVPDVQLSKIVKESLAHVMELSGNDCDREFQLFLKEFKDVFPFDIALVDLSDSGDPEILYTGLSLLESIVAGPHGGEIMCPEGILTDLMRLSRSAGSSEAKSISRANQISALKSAIILTTEESLPSEAISTATHYVSDVSGAICQKFNSKETFVAMDQTDQDILLLQLGLALNLVNCTDGFGPIDTSALAVLRDSGLEGEVPNLEFLKGYVGLLYGTLHTRGVNSLSGADLQFTRECLQAFHSTISEKSMHIRIEQVLDKLTGS